MKFGRPARRDRASRMIWSPSREQACAMVVGAALRLASHPRAVEGAVARILARASAPYDHGLADAEHVLRRVLEEFDPASVEALEVANAIAAVTGARQIGTVGP